MADFEQLNALYEPDLTPARTSMATDARISRLLTTASADVVLRTLIEYCAIGVQMTEPVERWVKGAGERCVTVGYEELGKALIKHAKHEAGHHEMMIADTRKLVARWNASHSQQLDADKLLAQGPTKAVSDYVELHEATIRGSEPFAQIAIEYEIESVSVTLGPKVVGRCVELFGKEILADLSFVEEHVALDVGHSAFNRRQLNNLLIAHPESAQSLVRAGSDAIDCYARFVGDCVSIAESGVSAAA